MSEQQLQEQHTPLYLRVIYGAESNFQDLVCGDLKFQQEALHARMACEGNSYLMKAVDKNPGSLQKAVYSVATVGLSLNRATSYAYLVPRDGEVCLDISYKGLIKIATDTGSIRWAKAEIVYANDSFLMKQIGEQPEHSFDPFGDRGEAVGVYCVAKTSDGDYLAGTMSKAELMDIKKKSPSASSSYSPWNTFEHEMWKKCVIKRESKTWPKTERSERLHEAIQIVNDQEGIDFNAQHTPEQLSYYEKTIEGEGMPLEHFCFIKSLEYETIASLGSAHKSTIDRGGKGKEMERVDSIYREGESTLSQIAIDINESDDEFFIQEQIEGLPDGGWEMIQHQLSAGSMAKIEQLREVA